VVHGGHIVDHLIDVFGSLGRIKLRLGGQEILQRALRAFDLAGKNGLLTNVHEDEKVGVR